MGRDRDPETPGVPTNNILTSNVLTNKDVVALAKAGFNEDFIIDTISMSRTRFDTTVNGLVDLAKEGMTERLIRFMMTTGANTPATAAPAPAADVPPGAVIAGPELPEPPHRKGRVIMVKPSAVHQALAGQTSLTTSGAPYSSVCGPEKWG